MNIYDNFFRGMTPEEWEFFAMDFLSSSGYTVIEPPARGADGGKDAIVRNNSNGMEYIVSCKHFIMSGSAIGVNDEPSITDRIAQHKVNGFIGFYSTVVSQALQDRLKALQQFNYDYIIFDKNNISNHIPNMYSFILQKYGIVPNLNFINPNISSYYPLGCMVCGKDILTDNMPKLSLAGMVLDKEGRYMYVFGCKEHFIDYEMPFIDGHESLHPEVMISWGNYVRWFSENNPIALDFWDNFSLHQTRVAQVQYPSNYGVHPASLIC